MMIYVRKYNDYEEYEVVSDMGGCSIHSRGEIVSMLRMLHKDFPEMFREAGITDGAPEPPLNHQPVIEVVETGFPDKTYPIGEARPATNVCPRCNGSGWKGGFTEERVMCTECGGTGVVFVSAPDISKT